MTTLGVGAALIAERAGHLNVSEIFGPTIQGEGPQAGRLTSFLRLGGCNLSCSWCDTPFTWDWERFDRSEQVQRWTLAEVVRALADLPGRITVSGGEPLLQQKALATLITTLPEREWDVETNGTRPLADTLGLWSSVVASPKIVPSAGQDSTEAALDPQIVAHADAFKFVVATPDDLVAVDRCVEAYRLPVHKVWLMPEGTDTDTLTDRTPYVADAAVERGFNFTTRLHTYGWGDARGH